jgi:hypothetical protein
LFIWGDMIVFRFVWPLCNVELYPTGAGAVRNVVGIRCGAISSDIKLSDHAARSIC